MMIHVLHGNPGWYPPFAAAFDAAGLEHREWLLDGGSLDLAEVPPGGIYRSRLSASSPTRNRPHAKEYARSLLDWLERHGRRTVNGRLVVEIEVSKVRQLAALRAFGIDVPDTVVVMGREALADAARGMRVPFITKHNQGGKGLGVRRFDALEEFDAYIASDEFEEPVDGITLLQEYVRPAGGMITRVETVGYQFIYAIHADAERGGFQLCPSEACEIDEFGRPKDARSLFSLRQGFQHPIIDRLLAFAREYRIEIGGFEFIESEDGRLLVYDVNTNTNYNPDVDAVAPRSGPAAIAAYLHSLGG